MLANSGTIRTVLPLTLAAFLLSGAAQAQREGVEREPRERAFFSAPATTALPINPALPQSPPAPAPIPTEFADREPDLPAPAGYRREYRLRPWESVAGGTLFALGYAPALWLGVAASTYEEGPECQAKDVCHGHLIKGKEPLVMPVLGPLLFLPACDNNSGCYGVILADTALQIAGLYLLVDGLINHPYLVKEETPLTLPRMSVSAAASPGGSMIAVSGVF